MTDYNEEERTLDLPDTGLPFFSYGIFKPGQLAYSKIRGHVFETRDAEINYGMKVRDGVPILIDKKSDYSHTKGFIITFKEGHEERAYRSISNTMLRKLYEWKTIEINGKLVNVLFGVDPNKGSSYMDGLKEDDGFDGKSDPFFKEAIELIEKNLNSDNDPWDIESFFELQMNYMLLWAAIDRYSSLKYNKRKNIWNYEKFSNQRAFKKGILKFKDEFHNLVFSTDDLEIHEFNVDEPLETLLYYYTFRCNVVHRGKAQIGDYSMLRTAAKELLEIFKDVLEDTFDENL